MEDREVEPNQEPEQDSSPADPNASAPTTQEEREAEAAFREQSAERQKVNRDQAAAKARKAQARPKKERTHLIKLHNNPEIPPGGQYVGVNGRWILLVPNTEMEVPESALEVLDNAVRHEAEKDEHNRVVGTREVPRFPYTFVRRPSR